MSKDILDFVVYMIHACAKKWGKTPVEVYNRLVRDNCIDGYLVPHYEILHTQSTEFVVKDIEEFIGTREAAV